MSGEQRSLFLFWDSTVSSFSCLHGDLTAFKGEAESISYSIHYTDFLKQRNENAIIANCRDSTVELHVYFIERMSRERAK